MSRPIKRRICRNCIMSTLAGVSWPVWGDRQGWPKLTRCADCSR